jgi:hypothetical protein
MPWPVSFRQQLYSGQRVHQSLILDVWIPATGEGVGLDRWFACTDPTLQPFAYLLQKRGYEPALGASAVRPQSWSYVEGAWSVTIQVPDGTPSGTSAGRSYLALAAQALRRGAFVRLSIGETGYSRSDYQPLRLGRVYSVRQDGHPSTFRVDIWDLQTGLRTRPSTVGSGSDVRQRLFYGCAGQQDTLSSDYTAGDSSLTITGSTADRFLTEIGQDGAVRVTPDTGDDFYLSFTGQSGSTLSGLSSTGQYGTTEGDAAAGNRVSSAVLLEGHPLDILRRVLTSTGTGTNGPADIYPQQWGLAIPAELFDLGAWAQAERILQLSSGSYHWRLIVEQEIDDPAAWIAQTWGAAGIWICVREGMIVPRVARDPNTAGLNRQVADLSDDDLAEVPSVTWYPADVPETFTAVRVYHGTSVSSSVSNTTTLPSREELPYDLVDQTIARSNAADIAVETRDRLAPWGHLCPEYVDVTVWGLRSYAPGDVIHLTSSAAYGRLDGTRDGYAGRPVFVIREQMDLRANRTRLTLAVLPLDITEDGGT